MAQISNFAQAHKVLGKLIPRTSEQGSYSLERIQVLMNKLGNPQDSYKVVHVAGTSGKTSTCYYAAALLQQMDKKVGLTVSPHVDEVNERVQINLAPLPENKFCRELSEFIEVVNKTGIKPTYFELLIAFAYWEFAKQKVDYAVVEVGLGGLVDGTNVIHRPDKVCTITDIGLDHTNVLGGTLAEIATQKAGIIGDHNNIFAYIQSPEIMTPIMARCALMHATLHQLDKPDNINLNTDLPPFQRRNLNLAKQACDFIARRDELAALNHKQLRTVANIVVPARMEIVNYRGKTIIVDGSHNEQKIAALLDGIKYKYPNQPMSALVSFGQNKSEALQASMALLSSASNHIIVTKFKLGQEEVRRPVDPKLIVELCHRIGFGEVSAVSDPVDAFRQLLQKPEELLLITGSFYLLNHIRPLILNK